MAVITPAENSPDAPRATMAPAVLADVADDPSVMAPVVVLAVIPPPLAKLNTPLLVIVTGELPS